MVPLDRYLEDRNEEDITQDHQTNILRKLFINKNSIEGLSSSEFSQYIFGLEVKKLNAQKR